MDKLDYPGSWVAVFGVRFCVLMLTYDAQG
jgi:hypothetical protein